MIQNLFDGVLVGAIISLGAIGLTLMMQILRFANFSHAELLSIGAYCALVFDKLFSALTPAFAAKWGALSLTTSLAAATLVAIVITGASAVIADRLVFKRLRDNAGPLTMVFASFGVALIIRNVIGLVFGLSSQHYTNDITFAIMVSTDPFLLIKPDQLFVLGMALAAMIALHLVMSRTPIGFALRAIAENPTLAQVNGVNLKRMVAITWLIGGGLAALAGVSYALTNQLSPVMGRDLVLSLFAAAIFGGLGSVSGAVIGGFVVGLASSLSLLVLPPDTSPRSPSSSSFWRSTSGRMVCSARRSDDRHHLLSRLLPDDRADPRHCRARPEPAMGTYGHLQWRCRGLLRLGGLCTDHSRRPGAGG